MKTETPTLSTLHAELAALRALPCRLVHERVLMDENGIRRRDGAVESDPGMVRVGLCSKAVRDQQLSCAHTRARNVLDKAIVASATHGLVSAQEAAQLRAELKRIDLAIHMTDWEKNQAEVRYALLAEQGRQDGLPGEQQHVDELVARHGQLSAELGRIHGLLLERCKAVHNPA
ncbi:hypothetical protein [Pseudoduganella rhizocola]|uniref:hypothetical protein n=1 Tax=Pseudoduganella rhizocola TaxID=3382643 RepID=UPI0038B51857